MTFLGIIKISKFDLDLDLFTLHVTFQGHEVIYQRSTPNNILDPLPMHTKVVAL